MGRTSALIIERVKHADLDKHHTDRLLRGAKRKCHLIGVETLLDFDCRLSTLAESLRRFFSDPTVTLVGPGVAARLLRILKTIKIFATGVDLGSLVYPEDYGDCSWKIFHACLTAMGHEDEKSLVDALWPPSTAATDELKMKVLHAWMSYREASGRYDSAAKASKLEVQHLDEPEHYFLAAWQRVIDLTDAARPSSYVSDFESVRQRDGSVVVSNTHYKTRIRTSKQSKSQEVHFHSTDGHLAKGQPWQTTGKRTMVEIQDDVGEVGKITVMGLAEATQAEQARDRFILRILQGKRTLQDSLFSQLLYLPHQDSATLLLERQALATSGPNSGPQENALDYLLALNESQRRVALAMLAETVLGVVLTHGPPGTGKTRTIAAAVRGWIDTGRSAWLVAQTNVGVKNIAESLIKNGCHSFKLIVSREFMFEWHEHLYRKLYQHVIRSDHLRKGVDAALGDAKIILCTLGMLSNPEFEILGLFDRVHVERLIMDEASQIYINDYMHLFDMFSSSLKKVCWFGDPKQLPPYGRESVKELRSVFDVDALRGSGFFLDTQYRMPRKMGDFVSEHMYNNKLKSSHSISSWDCLAFVDVACGTEVGDQTSFKNPEEARAIVHLIWEYYRSYDWRCLTPYDAQRNEIESSLKQAGLDWEGKVFNVDSFQGNKAPYIFISVVRTESTGFLKNNNRANVMLTRAQAGIVVVSNREFLRTSASYTLVGQLAYTWERSGKTWVTYEQLESAVVDLPGVLAPRSKTMNALTGGTIKDGPASAAATTEAAFMASGQLANPGKWPSVGDIDDDLDPNNALPLDATSYSSALQRFGPRKPKPTRPSDVTLAPTEPLMAHPFFENDEEEGVDEYEFGEELGGF